MCRCSVVACVVFCALTYISVTLTEEADCAGTQRECEEGTTVCVGGSENITADEFVYCIAENGCNITYRHDSCGRCDYNPTQYQYGSQYKDCNGDCFTEANKSLMVSMDECDVCGGDGSTCNPAVQGTDVTLVSDTHSTILSLTGKGFLIPAIQIVVYENVSSSEDPPFELTVKALVEIREIVNGTTMIVSVFHGLQKGEYRLGARVGIRGKEYEDNPGVVIYVYSNSDFLTNELTPREVNLVSPGSSMNVTISMNITDNTYLTYTDGPGMFCLISSSASGDSENTTVTAATEFDLEEDNVIFTIEQPPTSRQVWVCPSVDGQQSLGCNPIKFFQVAPTVLNNQATFSDDGNSIVIRFNMAVDSERDIICADVLDDISRLGDAPTCRFNVNKDTLTVRFGDLPMLTPGDAITIKNGLQASIGEFRRVMSAVTVDVVWNDTGEEAPNFLMITPRSYWPRELTGCATSPITLGIAVSQTTNLRPPESIVWKVNNIVQDSARNRLEVDIDVVTPDDYVISVTVTDFLATETTLTHTVVKSAMPMPSVTFSPQGLRTLTNGQYAVYPRTVFGIGTRIQHGTCLDGTGDTLDSFHFNWTRNGQLVEGQFFYKSSVSENTVEMCGESFEYKLSIIRKTNPADVVDTSLNITTECRPPVVRILGSKVNEIAVTYPHKVSINGVSSYDPDGGPVSFSWTCQTDGQDCLVPLGLSLHRNRSELIFSPSILTVGSTYTFSLAVTAMKSDGNYSSTDTVQFIAVSGNLPTVQIITLEHNFRHNVRILIKAKITKPEEGTDITAEWRFVPDIDDYEWVDLSNATVGKSHTIEGYTWYTIFPHTLTAGMRYMIQVRATMNGNAALSTTQDHDLYIYRDLRLCELDARDITELEQTTLVLHSCYKDLAATWLEASCSILDKNLPSTEDLTFVVPIFTDRSVGTVNVTCEVRDSLGHKVTVSSNNVSLTLISDDKLNAVLQEKIIDAKSKDDLVGALELLTSKVEKDSEYSSSSDQKEIVTLLKKIQENKPNARNLKRAIKSVKVIQPDKLNDADKIQLVKEMSKLIDALGREDGSEKAARLTNTEIQEFISTVRKLVVSEKRLMPYYRDIVDSVACVQMKTMKNDEMNVIELEDGARQTVAVLTLDDTSAMSDNVFVPDDLKRRFRGLWQCKNGETCDDVCMKTEEYKMDPPDIQTGRTDNQCAQYITMDLYNPKTCESIPVKDNLGLFELKMINTCSRAKCWFYNRLLERFDDHGVTTKVTSDGSLYCQTDHLTTFTLKSEPEKTKVFLQINIGVVKLRDGCSMGSSKCVVYDNVENYPLIIAAVFGTFLLVTSLYILLKAFCVTKLESMRREEEEDRRIEECANRNSHSGYLFYNNIYNNSY